MKNDAFSNRLDAFDARLVRYNAAMSFLSSGQIINAIKVYREDTGASLADAKAAVERIEQRIRLGISPQVEQASSELTTEAKPVDIDALRSAVESLISQKNIIHAIKLYREQTGVGLREAKDAVDQMG